MLIHTLFSFYINMMQLVASSDMECNDKRQVLHNDPGPEICPGIYVSPYCFTLNNSTPDSFPVFIRASNLRTRSAVRSQMANMYFAWA